MNQNVVLFTLCRFGILIVLLFQLPVMTWLRSNFHSEEVVVFLFVNPSLKTRNDQQSNRRLGLCQSPEYGWWFFCLVYERCKGAKEQRTFSALLQCLVAVFSVMRTVRPRARNYQFYQIISGQSAGGDVKGTCGILPFVETDHFGTLPFPPPR